jgi:hypothetical protein
VVEWLPGVRDLRRWRQLPPSQRRLLLRLLLLLPVVASAISIFGLARVRRVLLRLAPDVPPNGSGKLPEARALGKTVDLAARRAIGRPACLPRSLTLWWLLRRRGIDSDLRIGVRTAGGSLKAHAWVEHAGQVVNDEDDVAQRFVPFEGVNLPASWSNS